MADVERHPKSGVFRFRRGVPPHLRDILKQTAFTKSLGTRDQPEAYRRALPVAQHYQKLFDDAEAVHRQRSLGQPVVVALTLAEAATAVDRWREAELARVAQAIATRPRRLSATHADAERYLTDLARPARERRLLVDAAHSRTEGVAALNRRVEEIARDGGFVLPKEHPMHATMARLVRSAWAAVLDQEEAWLRGGWTLDNLPVAVRRHLGQHAPIAAPPQQQQQPRKRQLRLAEMLDKHWRRHPRTNPTTRSEQKLAVERLREFMGGDALIHTIDIEHAEGFFEALCALPRAMSKAHKAMGIRALAAARKRGDLAGVPTIAMATATKQVRLLSAMVKDAVRLDYADKDPFGAVLPRGEEARASYAPFSREDIAAIFGAPLFRGCRDDDDWRTAGAYRIWDHRFWIPLLCLTTGARLEEIGQLLARDIKEEDGVLYTHVTDIAESDDAPEKSLNTRSSRRRVPLHRIVLDAGFREYLGGIARSGEDALFPALRRDSRGKKTGEFSKWFNDEFLESVGISGKAKVLHSFRHLFKDRCREAELPEELHDPLTGHAGRSVGREYGRGISMRRLAEGMARIEFPGFAGVSSPLA